MIKEYETKDMKAPEGTTMTEPDNKRMTPPENMEDGVIFEEDGLFYFKWKGGMCGFASKENAEIGLLKSSGKFQAKS